VWAIFLILYFFYPTSSLCWGGEIDFAKALIIVVTLTFSLVLFYKGKFNFTTERKFSLGARKISYNNEDGGSTTPNV
jgi:hypothetical protein